MRTGGNSPADPPRAATWLLEHLGNRYRRESLAGDLIEQYRAGRTAAWYWRQVVWSLAAAAGHALRTRRSRLLALRVGVCLLLVVTLAREYPVMAMIFALDPSLYWLYSRTRKRRRSEHPCVQ
ncbi:MAG TPA: hypothetical protein VHX52_00410 [Steroidobacteraceae bacterium]|jgi:Flp pilus assembly protein TadB|nr:hypothetical protein [Steroidobacteraceae bacterium]